MINNLLEKEEKEFAKKVQEGRLAAIRFLGLARKPSGRVRSKLHELGFADEVITEVIHTLQQEERIDDRRLALNIIRRRRGRLAESRRALAHRLKQAGIERQVIDEVLPEKSEDYHLACELLQSRFKLLEYSNAGEKNKVWLKMARFLAGRGFAEATIRKVLDQNFPGIDTSGEDQA